MQNVFADMPTPLCEPWGAEASKIACGVSRLFSDYDYRTVRELTLANHRRADLVSIGPRGEVVIVEIKSSVPDFRADQKWPEYAPYCDRFYFAVNASFPQNLIPDHAGLIVADGFGGSILREPEEHRLAGARRKAVTLRFARLAASRLSQMLDSDPTTP